MRLRCAVLDDFQDVATDHRRLVARSRTEVEVVTFTEHFGTEDELAAALADFDIVVTLRERVPFPASLLARLPRLKLLVASGMRNSVIDYAAAEQHGVTVCGTASSSDPARRADLGADPGPRPRHRRRRAPPCAPAAPGRAPSAPTCTAAGSGCSASGKIGSRVAQVGLAFGMDVSAWSQNLTKERADEVGVDLAASKEELLRDQRLRLRPPRPRATAPAACSAPPNSHSLQARPPTWSTPPAPPSSTRTRCSPPCARAGSRAPASTSSTSSRCPADHPMRTAPRPARHPAPRLCLPGQLPTYYGQAVEDIQAFLAGAPVRRLP